MSERQEVLAAKVISAIIIALTILCYAAQADSTKIVRTFKKYNPLLSEDKAEEIAKIVTETSKYFRIDPNIIAGIIINESTVREKAISSGGDYGLMQVRWKVHRKDIQKQFPQVRKAKDLLNPTINIFIGTQIFARYYGMEGSIRGGLLRYSGGNGKLASKVLGTIEELRK